MAQSIAQSLGTLNRAFLNQALDDSLPGTFGGPLNVRSLLLLNLSRSTLPFQLRIRQSPKKGKLIHFSCCQNTGSIPSALSRMN